MRTIKSHYYIFILANVLLVNMLLLIFGGCNIKTDESDKNKESNIIHPNRGDTLINSFGIALIYIPAGEYMMGSRETPEEVVNTEGGKVEWYSHDYYTYSPTTDPKGPSSGQYRVLRGGSWHDGPAFCRAAFRNKNEPDYTTDDNGLRIVLEKSTK